MEQNEINNQDIVINSDAEKPKNKNKLIIICATIIGVLIISIVIILVVLNLNKKEAEDTTTPETSETTGKKDNTTKVVDPDTAVRNLVSDLYNVASNFLNRSNSPAAVEQVYDSFFPVFKLDTSNVPIAIQKSYGIKTSVDIDLTLSYNLEQEIRKTLINDGFKSYDYYPGFQDTVEEFYNSKTDIVCVSSMNSVPYDISCSSTSWISADTVALASSLADAYKKVEGEYPSMISVNKNDIENSPFEPYQKLTVSMVGFVALFYRSSPTADWVYFTGTQATLPCSTFEKDTGARRAFQGETCYDERTGEDRKVTNGS